jgi:rhodanese-related sulfurtransferase
VLKSNIIREIIYIILISLIISIITNIFHPGGLSLFTSYSPLGPEMEQNSGVIEGPNPIVIEEAASFHNDPSFVFVDARSKADFDACHIENAINLPEHSFEKCVDEFMNTTDINQSIITYCSSLDCPLASHLAEKLFFLGFAKVYYLIGGLDAWQERGLPVKGVQ